MKDSSDYITANQLADLLGVSIDCLTSWRKTGKGPRYYRLGDSPKARVRYKTQEVERWLEENQSDE